MKFCHFLQTNKPFFSLKIEKITNTRSPIFSSLSPFLTDPVSERLETDSLFVWARLEAGVAGGAGVAGAVEEAFLAVAVVEGNADLALAPWEPPAPTEGVGDAARDGGAI